MKKYCQNIIPALFIIILLLIWEAAVGFFHIPLYVLPSPVQVIRTLFSELGTLGGHAAVTVSEALSGIVISLILALLLGIVMDCFPIIKQGLYPVLVVTQTVPMIVLAPILIIYMGFGVAPKILTVVLMCFFPIAVSFSDGLAQVDEEYVHLVRSYSISGAVVGEWIGSQKGLGYYLLRVKNSYMLDKVFACVLVIIFLSLCMNGLIRLYQLAALPYLHTKN